MWKSFFSSHHIVNIAPVTIIITRRPSSPKKPEAELIFPRRMCEGRARNWLPLVLNDAFNLKWISIFFRFPWIDRKQLSADMLPLSGMFRNLCEKSRSAVFGAPRLWSHTGIEFEIFLTDTKFDCKQPHVGTFSADPIHSGVVCTALWWCGRPELCFAFRLSIHAREATQEKNWVEVCELWEPLALHRH